MSIIKRGVIQSYDPAAHKAVVQIAGSLAVWLAGVRVATSIPPADVVTGRQCTVLFLDPANQDEALVLTIQGAAPSVGQVLQASATSSLTLTTSPQSITGDGDSSKVRLLLPTPGDWLVEATFDFVQSVADVGDMYGELFVNDSGSPESAKAILHVEDVERATVPQRWKVTTTAANTPVELKAKKQGAGGTGAVNATHTRLTASGVKRAAGGIGGTHPVDLASDVSGVLPEANVHASLARDSEVTSSIATHAAIAAAHHAKYTDAAAVAAVVAQNPLALVNDLKIGGNDIYDSNAEKKVTFRKSGIWVGGDVTDFNANIRIGQAGYGGIIQGPDGTNRIQLPASGAAITLTGDLSHNGAYYYLTGTGDTKSKIITSGAVGVGYVSYTLQSTGATNNPYMEFQFMPSNTAFASYVRYNYSGGGTTVNILTLDGYGKVAIGTTPQSDNLHVVGTGRFTSHLRVDGDLKDSAGAARLTLGATSIFASLLTVQTTGDVKHKVVTTSVVGVGYASLTLQSTGATNNPYFEFQLMPSNTAFASYVRYNYNGGGTTVNVLTLDGYGKVAIGTTPQSENLHVVGTAKITSHLELDGDLNHDGSNVGFYATAPVAQQTGVAVTAAAVHAALVNLGLITA